MWNIIDTRACSPLCQNLQAHYQFKVDLQTVDQHTGGKWLIRGTNLTNLSTIFIFGILMYHIQLYESSKLLVFGKVKALLKIAH